MNRRVVKTVNLSAVLLCIYLLGFITSVIATNTRDLCNRDDPDTAASKTSGDNGFRIKIAGRPPPERYTPGQVYTVSINGTYPNQRLLGFMLVAVPLNARDESTEMGSFQHLNSGLTRNAAQCPYVITHSYRHPKAGVEVLWTAPVTGSGCIEFRATVIEHADIWYKDDGALTRVFCEETAQVENHQSLEMIPDCCACGTGKYQMTFHGQWSSRTHPNDYPSIQRLLHWSNVVGASHSKRYSVWQYGGYATQGVKEVCEFAYTRTLEEEMREHSGDIRTVIKTPGIWYSEPHGLRQSRWARFSVDRRNHLLSMLSMIGPSPDWCVGVSAVNLCLPNCTWAGDQTIDLYPWDAGTDDGISYMSPNMISNPAQPIQRITNTSPNNPNQPFYGARPVRRLAQLEIRRLYPTDGDVQECVPGEEVRQAVEEESSEEEDQGECAVTDWTEWSDCSVTCGVGQSYRRRAFVHATATKALCGVSLSESENCLGVENECEVEDVACQLTGWSNWSPCTATCGSGVTERRRSYLRPQLASHCDQETSEVRTCTAAINCAQAQYMKNFTAICALPMATGPCRGQFLRWYYDNRAASCQSFLYGGCRGNNNRFQTQQECTEMCGSFHTPADASAGSTSVITRTSTRRRQKPRRQSTTTISTTPSATSTPHIITTTSTLTPSPTPSTTPTSTSPPRPRDCRISKWSPWTACSSTCGKSYKQRTRTVLREASNGGQRCPRKLVKRKRCQVPKCVDCQMSEWSEWTACARTCGTGSVQERTRQILSEPRRNGLPCGVTIERRYCRLAPCPRPLPRPTS